MFKFSTKLQIQTHKNLILLNSKVGHKMMKKIKITAEKKIIKSQIFSFDIQK